jgi:Holliday junction resolvase RusA-like endonuclease
VRPFLRGGKPRVYMPTTAAPWQDRIALAIRPFLPSSPYVGAVEIDVTFYFARPKGHYGSGKNAAALKQNAPRHHTSRTDVDNLLKSLLDAMTHCAVWRDDAQVVTLKVRKRFATGSAGAQLVVRPALED